MRPSDAIKAAIRASRAEGLDIRRVRLNAETGEVVIETAQAAAHEAPRGTALYTMVGISWRYYPLPPEHPATFPPHRQIARGGGRSHQAANHRILVF